MKHRLTAHTWTKLLSRDLIRPSTGPSSAGRRAHCVVRAEFLVKSYVRMRLKCMWMCAVSWVNMHGLTHFNAWSLSAAHSYLSAAHTCIQTHSCCSACNHTLTHGCLMWNNPPGADVCLVYLGCFKCSQTVWVNVLIAEVPYEAAAPSF